MREYALKHPEVRHRELAWQMVDEDVVYLSQSTIYRILREECLVSPWRRRRKRTRREEEKAGRPDERWATDLMYLRIGSRQYFLVNFIDEYSRYIVHYELLPNMEGGTVSLAAQRAIESFCWSETVRSHRVACRRSERTTGAVMYRGISAPCWTPTT